MKLNVEIVKNGEEKRTIMLNVDSSLTVKNFEIILSLITNSKVQLMDIMMIVEEESGINRAKQRVFHNNRNLINYQQSLEFYGITEGNIVKICDNDTTTCSFDPLNVEVQRRIEQQIHQNSINESFEKAMEFTPELFVPVEMLYIECELNKVSIKAFIDTGAQKSVMSPSLGEKCGIMHLLDKRFSGVAVGIGSAKIVGTVHYVPIKIGVHFLPCSVHVVEGIGVDFIFGLDMLKRHQIVIDLSKNCLIIAGDQINFVNDSSSDKHSQLTTSSSSTTLIESSINSLIQSLGISREAAIHALEATSGNVELAASLLLGENQNN